MEIEIMLESLLVLDMVDDLDLTLIVLRLPSLERELSRGDRGDSCRGEFSPLLETFLF